MPSGREWNDRLAPNTVDFFLGAIGGHSKVTSVEQESQNVFVVTRVAPLSQVRAWVCDVYTVGIADYMSIRQTEPEAGCIVTMSGYNSWTREAKAQGFVDDVGVFKFGEFMGALNFDDTDFVHYERRTGS